MVQCIVAVIERAGKFLVGKRSPHKKSAPGYWCPITGKMEDDETQQEAVAREVFEETGLRVEAVRKIAAFDTRDKTAHLHWWLVRIVSGEEVVSNHEHSEMRWVSVDEMKLLEPVFEEDVAVFEELALPKVP